MPIDCYWNGTTDNFETPGNWFDSDLVTPKVAAPTTGDSIYFVTGSQAVATNYGQSDIALVNCVVTDGYSGLLGVVDNPLKLDVTNFTYAGQGANAYITLESDVAEPTATVVMVLGTGTGTLTLGTGTNGTISSAQYLGGTVVIAAAAAHTAATNILAATMDPANPLSLTIGTTATNIATITHLSGALAIASAFTTLNQHGGTVTHTAGALATANVYRGTLEAESAGTIGAINIYDAGAVDGSGSHLARTWSAVEMWGDASLNIANGLGNITLTANIKTHTDGQLRITADNGSTVAIS